MQFERINESSSSPLKIEVTGTLVPIKHFKEGRLVKFRLDEDSKEYFLDLNLHLEKIAKKIEWETVTIKGFLNPDTEMLEVEKITLPRSHRISSSAFYKNDESFDSSFFERMLKKFGKLESYPEYLAS